MWRTLLCGLAMLLLWLPHDATAYEVVNKPLPSRLFESVNVDLGGFVQPRFRFSPDDTAAGTDGDIGFSLQRVRLELKGDLLAPDGSRWGLNIRQKYSIELIPEPRLQDAYINVGLGTLFQLRFGQFKAPIHRAILVSDANNLFPDRSQITGFVPERELGLMLHGWWGSRQLEWQAAVFNGEGKNRVGNVNRKFMYVGRFVVSPFGSPGASYEILRDWRPEGSDKDRPLFSLGYSFHYNVDGPVGQEEAYVGHNGEFFFHWRFLTVMSEFFFKFSDWEVESIRDYQQIGGYVQFGAFLEGIPWARDHVAIMGRFEQGDAFVPLVVGEGAGGEVDLTFPAAGALDPGLGSRRYAVGVGLYAGRPLFRLVQEARLVFSYTIKEEVEWNQTVDDLPSGFAFDNNEFNISANLTF